MKTKVALLVALLALAPAALAACGGDDDEDTTDEPTTTAPTDENGAAGGGGGGGGGGDVVQVTADPGGDLAYVEDSLTAQANGVTFELTNDASIPHDIRIEEDGQDIGGTETVTGGTTEATVDLESGEYTFYCSVPGHREGGMEGTLTVN